uniref:Cadherin domain-containing protein n=1 Tax=Xiphophorus couchianus TaxID=32473 RepID=A0A3B5KSF4_9TELE
MVIFPSQVTLFIFVLSLAFVLGQVSYTVPEEMAKGSLIGNLAHDLGLQIKRLTSGKARIFTRDSDAYFELNRETGVLLVKEKIDREALCKKTTPCALQFQIILENPMEFYSVTVQITDINDNAPKFEKDEIDFRISESAVTGAKFALERAVDLDVGINDLKSYTLKPTQNFALKLHNNPDGNKNLEMVLQKPLDREKQEKINLVLTAVDGGEPQMSGTMLVVITVLDVNDNAPVFTQQLYRASVIENSPQGTIVTAVTASDADEGSNSKIRYSIRNTLDDVRKTADSGVIHAVRSFDYEQIKDFQFCIKAQDGGSPPLSSNVTVKMIIQDQNDNPPQVLYPVQTGGSMVAEMVCRTTDSRKSDNKFGQAVNQNLLIMDPSSTGTMQRIHSEKNILDEPDSPLEVRHQYN